MKFLEGVAGYKLNFREGPGEYILTDGGVIIEGVGSFILVTFENPFNNFLVLYNDKVKVDLKIR